MSADYCMAIEGYFAWFEQRCMKTAVSSVRIDGETFPVCEEHAP